MQRFMSYKKPLFQDWERWLFYLLHRNQQRESKKMKKQSNVFQMKEQENPSEKTLMKWEVNYLPDKEFKIIIIKMLIKVKRMHELRVPTRDRKYKTI